MSKLSLKYKVIELRRKGYSYAYIGKKLSLAKSTLSSWLTRVPYTPNQITISKMGQARLTFALRKARAKKRDFQRARHPDHVDIFAADSALLKCFKCAVEQALGNKFIEPRDNHCEFAARVEAAPADSHEHLKVQQMAQFIFFGFEIFGVVGAGRRGKRDAFRDFKPVAFKSHDFAGVVGNQT